jgi:hypothetical protein
MNLFPKIGRFPDRVLEAADDDTILWLWDQRLDTVEIARSMRVRESEVHNRLTPLRQKRAEERKLRAQEPPASQCKST